MSLLYRGPYGVALCFHSVDIMFWCNTQHVATSVCEYTQTLVQCMTSISNGYHPR